MEAAVVVEGEETVVDEGGEPGVFSGGNGAGFPFARVQGDFGGLELKAKGAAVFGMFGGEEDLGQEEKETETEKLSPLKIPREVPHSADFVRNDGVGNSEGKSAGLFLRQDWLKTRRYI